MQDHPPVRPVKVAYFLGKFPQLTQTFVTRELLWIREHGIAPLVFSFAKPETLPSQSGPRELLEVTHYGSASGLLGCVSLIGLLLRSPLRLGRALGNLLRHTLWEPSLFVRALMTLPKTVCFAREIEAQGIAHVHAHFLTLASVQAGVAADILGIKYSVTVHAVGLFTRNRNNIRRQMTRAARIVTISRYHREKILELCPEIPPEHVSIIHCGLETERFVPARTNDATSRAPRVLSIGRLVQKKGFEYLIDACAVLEERGVPFECVIIGEGPSRSSLAKRASDLGVEKRVTLLGAMEQPEILENYHRSDLFVLPNVMADDGNRDGLPVVLMEAMSCGLPVVTTRMTGTTDLVEDGITGVLVPEKDVGALVASLEGLMANENRRNELGQSGRRKVMREFRIQETTQQLAQVFLQVYHEGNGVSGASTDR
jgi:glycosyltransferase involved in cell wall biosynthesis